MARIVCSYLVGCARAEFAACFGAVTHNGLGQEQPPSGFRGVGMAGSLVLALSYPDGPRGPTSLWRIYRTAAVAHTGSCGGARGSSGRCVRIDSRNGSESVHRRKALMRIGLLGPTVNGKPASISGRLNLGCATRFSRAPCESQVVGACWRTGN